MSNGKGPEVSHPSTPTKVPTSITVQVTVPPGGTETRAIHTTRDVVLRDLETTKEIGRAHV